MTKELKLYMYVGKYVQRHGFLTLTTEKEKRVMKGAKPSGNDQVSKLRNLIIARWLRSMNQSVYTIRLTNR